MHLFLRVITPNVLLACSGPVVVKIGANDNSWVGVRINPKSRSYNEKSLGICLFTLHKHDSKFKKKHCYITVFLFLPLLLFLRYLRSLSEDPRKGVEVETRLGNIIHVSRSIPVLFLKFLGRPGWTLPGARNCAHLHLFFDIIHDAVVIWYL